MLQQTPTAGEDPVAQTEIEKEPWGEDASEASSDCPDDADLPQCRVKRNYNCSKCAFFTQNPRAYLTHARDVHNEKIKIYDCPQCVYASRHHQKLQRHIKMVHTATSKEDAGSDERDNIAPANETTPAPAPPSPTDDDDDDDDVEEVEDAEESGDAEMNENEEMRSLQCVQCDFVSSNRNELLKHERAAHDRQKYFSCAKCQYVTHIKARFTKHVKYHSMPMIKCTLCDFRTPYKWNLDRHMKNHGGGGNFCCCMCNFTADIKQSLTVHEMNHHTPAVGQYVSGRRRNKVGASDLAATAAAAAAAAAAALVAEDALVVKDEGSTDSHLSQSDIGSSHGNAADMASLNMESDDVAMVDHYQSQDDIGINTSEAHQSFQNVCSALESLRQARKLSRPIPQLIPLNTSTPTQSSTKTSPTEPPLKRFKDMFSGNVDLDILNYSSTDIFKVDRLPEDLSTPISSSPSMTTANVPRKKNESFFDKLKERLLTETSANGTLACKNCGFESKCLSEHSVHEKNCTHHIKSIIPNSSLTSLGSTRCQHCRHRCKSSADLYVHMQTCRTNNAAELEKPTFGMQSNTENVATSSQEEADQPHPMENVVFVWNTLSNTQDQSKLGSPLNISVPDDSSLADMGPRSYDPNNVDALHDNETESLSPNQTAGKRVFKCPHCPFWASTASRFHVHIVGHLNRKPFECSLCNYKSNWRWDITKHIRLKSVRDPEHNTAKVLMTDETGRRNYSKYSKYLSTLSPNEESKASSHAMSRKQMQDAAVNVDEPDILSASSNDNSGAVSIMPLDLQTHRNEETNEKPTKKTKKTLWKCKKCNYKNPSKEALLEHVREHTKSQTSETEDNGTATPQSKKAEKEESTAMAYQCGHCNQLSNWKHVIQRHCRLKHNGVIKVISVERPKQDNQLNLSDIQVDGCTKCPYKTNDKKLLLAHMQQHTPSPLSIFKCYFCPYFVKTEVDLLQHLTLHGVSDPDEYISKSMEGLSPPPEPILPVKRHKCTECPYETNSKSQFMYHEQFHRLPANTPYKCKVCNYSVTKRHLLHQHMKVHGLNIKKEPLSESEMFAISSNSIIDASTTVTIKTDDSAGEIPYVWVSAKNEFHKMYKCRYCSYVNSQQCKIPNHEKIHCIWYDNETTIYKCLECKFTCDSAIRLSEHSTIHGEIYGRIYCPVDQNVSDEEQITNLRQLLEEEKQNLLASFHKKEEATDKDVDMERMSEIGKTLFFCKKCPSRFFGESEWLLHNKFHELKFSIQCKICSFTVPQESQMASHTYVHTDDYQAKTKMLQMMHETHPDYLQPKVAAIKFAMNEEPIWIVIENNTTSSSINAASSSRKPETHVKSSNKQYTCEHCPAKFFKTSALSYHNSLHGGPGNYTCKKCDYTVKNIGNLVKHELVHGNDDSNATNGLRADFDSGDEMDFKNIPLSGTDLFQRKTEAQKRVNSERKLVTRPIDHFPPVLQADPQFGYLMHGNPEFIYPTYLKNGRQKEKRYKCHKCPSAFEKREQYKVHLSLHGSKQRYKCELCDYSVKYYANYVQHMRKHQMNAEAHAERNKSSEPDSSEQADQPNNNCDDNVKLAIKSIPKYTAKSDFLQFSIGDQQTLRLLQRRRSSASSSKEVGTVEPTPEKENNKKIHWCPYCPYTNQRRDALENHMKRHKCVSGVEGNYDCTHCDFSCNQSHFLRDHLKIHFNNHKNAQPQCFVQNEGVHLTITKIESEEQSLEINFLDAEKVEEACSKAADRIFIRPTTGEIVV